MTFIVADRVQETTNSPGTGTATLLGAVSGYQSFSTGIGANNTTFYVIADQLGTNWEVGLGALNATGTVLTRTTVYSSSNGGSTVNFATGTQYVWCDFPSSKAVIQGTAVNFSSIGATTAGTGAFTTLSASSTVSGAGFSNYFAAPPTIGNTTPNTGAFTNLSYTGTLTGGTGVVNLGSGQFYIDATGNVGIGTTAPATKLEIDFSSAGTTIASSPVLTLKNTSFTNGAVSGLVSQNSVGGNTSGIDFVNVNQVIDGGGASGSIGLWTNNSGTKGYRIYADNSGNVDIGGTSPSQVLTIASSASGVGMGFGESTGNYGNIWTTYSAGDFALAAGLQGSKTAEAFTSSYGGSAMYRSAIKLGAFNNVGIQFFTDTSSTVARGTVITPTERMRIDSSGNVLIGQTSTGFGKFVVNAGSSNSAEFKTNNATCLVNFTPTGYDRFALGVGTVNVNDFGITNATTSVVKFLITSSGNAVLQGGNTTANGVGVAFPATQVASSDANTLDDYEEGTWTPTDASGASLSITFNNATYTKIGRQVFVRCSTIVYPVTANGSSASIGGLPFTNAAGESASSALVSANAFANRALVVSSASTIFIYATASSSASTNVQLSAVTIYGFCATYIV